MKFSKKFFLIVVLCHVSVLFVKGQSTTNLPTLSNDGEKGIENEDTVQTITPSTPIVSTSSVSGSTRLENLSQKTSTRDSSAETDTQTSNMASTETNTAASSRTSTEGSTQSSSTASDTVMVTQTSVSLDTSTTTSDETTSQLTNDTENNASSSSMPSENPSSESSVSSTETSSQTTVSTETHTIQSGNGQSPTSEIVSATQETINPTNSTLGNTNATSSTVANNGDESSSTTIKSNTVTSSTINEDQSGSVEPLGVTNGTESTRVNTTGTETEKFSTTISPANYTVTMNTGAIELTSHLELSCANYEVDSFKQLLRLPCTLKSIIDIDYNRTTLNWKNPEGVERSISPGVKNYGVFFNFTEPSTNSTVHDANIIFDRDIKIDTSVDFTLKVFLVNGEFKKDNFLVKFMTGAGAAAFEKGNILFTVISVFIFMVYLF